MSESSEEGVERARKAFGRRKIMTLGEVAELIGRSIHTARRRLKHWQAVTSYNHNGRYYTLPGVPEFDGNGLWRWRGVYFSRYGNLKQTVVALVQHSPSGLDAGELRSLLGLDPRSFLSAFASDPRLRREKAQGWFVYYGADAAVYSGQRQRRSLRQATGREPTPSEAIAILVEKIKHPALSHEALSRHLRKQKVFVEAETLQHFFLRHGLRVKKTPRSI
jgi:transposase